MGVNIDLDAERKLCTFDTELLTDFLDGGREKKIARRALENRILSVPGLYEGIGAYDALGHEEYYDKSVEKATKLLSVCLNVENRMEALHLFNSLSFASCIIPDGNPLTLHFAAFLPVINSQGSDEQKKEWLMRGFNCEYLGTYAQTELGHGTNLRELQTTAEYDPETQEFVFNTPKLESMKWWPGGMGKTVNYVILGAHLITKGQNHGLHTFIVQIRSEEDHTPLPGVTVGEIGRKYGMNSNDNGYLMLKNVRMPRSHMLMRHAQVLPDGTYVKPKSDKLSYGSMVFLRVVIAKEIGKWLRKAATIAIRYSAVRRQSEIEAGKGEVQVIDFLTQQYKLFPALAFCFGVEFASEDVWKEYNSVAASIDRGDVSTLPMLHIRSCCLKVIVSSCSAEFVDILRRACGGHGFMMSSCFPKLYGQTTAACTYEGDNTVLLLQVARGILKPSFKWSKPVTGSLFIPAEKKVNLASVPGIFTTVARNRVEACQIELDQLQKSGLSTDAAWNSMGMRLIAAAESYGRQVVMDSFVAKLFTASVSPEILRVLKSLCRLLATSWIRRYSGEFITYGGLTAVDIQLIDECLEAELKEIRPNAVGIVDAFDFRDEILNSALGCYDGNVYERLLETAKKSPLNKKDVPDAFEKYLKPLMMQSKL